MSLATLLYGLRENSNWKEVSPLVGAGGQTENPFAQLRSTAFSSHFSGKSLINDFSERYQVCTLTDADSTRLFGRKKRENEEIELTVSRLKNVAHSAEIFQLIPKCSQIHKLTEEEAVAFATEQLPEKWVGQKHQALLGKIVVEMKIFYQHVRKLNAHSVPEIGEKLSPRAIKYLLQAEGLDLQLKARLLTAQVQA